MSASDLYEMARSDRSDDAILDAVRARHAEFVLTIPLAQDLRKAGRSVQFLARLLRAVRGLPDVPAGARPSAAPAAAQAWDPTSEPVGAVTGPEDFRPTREPPESELDACVAPGVGWRAARVGLSFQDLAGHIGVQASPTSRRRATAALGLLGRGYPASACAVARASIGDAAGAGDLACAVWVLREVRDVLDCPLPDPRRSAAALDAGLAPAARSMLAYLAATDLLDLAGEPAETLRLLASVLPGTRKYAEAQALAAFVEAGAQAFRTAARRLSLVAAHVPRDVEHELLREAVVIGLARIAAENRVVDDAALLYRSIPPSSRRWVEATYERAAVAMLAGRHSEGSAALDMLEAAAGPMLRAYPDVPVLRGLAHVAHCHVRRARALVVEATARLADERRHLAPWDARLERLESACDEACRNEVARSLDVSEVLVAFPFLGGLPAVRRSLDSTAQVEAEVGAIAAGGAPGAALGAVMKPLRDFGGYQKGRLCLALLDGLAAHRAATLSAAGMLEELRIDSDAAMIGVLASQVVRADGEATSRLVDDLARMARGGMPSADLRGVAAARPESRHLDARHIESLRRRGVPLDVVMDLDEASRAPPAGLDRLARDPSSVVWQREREVWLDELNAVADGIPDLCPESSESRVREVAP